MLTNNEHFQLQQLVAERLRTAILEGRFKPGEWLRQERLAQDLGVSQMPVREALKALAAEGLVEHIPYRGVRVQVFYAEDVEDLYDHRCFLESRAARAAAGNITTAELDELKDLHRRMVENILPAQLAEYRRLNRRFHEVIYTASRRRFLIRTLAQLWAAFPNMLLSNFATTAGSPLMERDDSDIREHAELIEALETRDAQRAEALITRHIQTTKQMLISSIGTGKQE